MLQPRLNIRPVWTNHPSFRDIGQSSILPIGRKKLHEAKSDRTEKRKKRAPGVWRYIQFHQGVASKTIPVLLSLIPKKRNFQRQSEKQLTLCQPSLTLPSFKYLRTPYLALYVSSKADLTHMMQASRPTRVSALLSRCSPSGRERVFGHCCINVMVNTILTAVHSGCR
jgi:hypothetical protein